MIRDRHPRNARGAAAATGAAPATIFAILATILAVVALVVAISANASAGGSSSSSPGTVYFDIDFRTTDLDLDDTFGYLDTPPSTSTSPPTTMVVATSNPNATDDGLISRDPIRGLVIDSSEFKQRRLSIFDHPKYLVLTQQPIVPAPGRRIALEATISMYTTGILNASATAGDPVLTDGLLKYASGIANPADDPRLACAALNLLDLQHAMVYDFIIVNQTIYALYEHLPFTTDTAVFTYAVPVGKRPADVHAFTNYRIEYDTGVNEVAWYIDGAEVFRVTQPGLPLPSPEHLVFLRGDSTPSFSPVASVGFTGGFGTFSLLDFLPFWGSYDPVGYNRYVQPDVAPTQPISILSDLPPLFPTDGLTYLRVPTDDGEFVPVTSVAHTITPMAPLTNDGQGAVQTVRNFKMYEP